MSPSRRVSRLGSLPLQATAEGRVSEERRREAEAQREQADRIDALAIGELDQDGLGRKGDARDEHQERADQARTFGAAGGFAALRVRSLAEPLAELIRRSSTTA